MKLDRRKLEIAMARAKLNKHDLAEKADMPIPTIGSICKRESCKPATAGRLADALGVDVTEIIE